MDRMLQKILTECIRDIETGDRDVEGCLQRHPDRAAELRPHLELWSGLNTASKAQPNIGSQQRGQQQLLAALSDMEETSGGSSPTIPTFAKAAAAAVAAVLLIGGAAGASAAFGGPDFAPDVLSTVGIASSHDDGTAADKLDEINDGDPAAATDGLDTAQDAVDDPLNNIAGENANEAAQPGLDTAGEAQEEAGDGPDPSGAAPEDVPPDSVPDDAPVPDSVPVGPTQ